MKWLLDGETSSTTVKYAYDNRIRVEIDSDKDGTVDSVQVYAEGDYENELPNAAPVITITFPQSIYTDTDMSQVQVNVYDPDLDGFTISYEWRVNDTVKASALALDNALFVKHDILALAVTAIDDRVGDIKSNTQIKTQEVLNSAPVAILDMNRSEIKVGEQILLDASKSYDVDGDSFTVDWFTQNRAYNVTDSTYNLGHTYLDINESNKSKILFIGEKINYISYASPTEIQPYGINLELNDGDTNGISELNSTDIIVSAMDLFIKEVTLLESQGIVGATTGDINSDGLFDVIVVTAYPSEKEIVVFLQNKVKSFSLAYRIPLSNVAPVSYASLDISDMNNDEINDIVLTSQSYGEDGFAVYYQDANNLGSFLKEQYVPKPVQEIIEEEPSVSDVNYHVVGDMNNDGKNDVLTIGYSNSFGGVGNNIEMFFQTEDGLDNNKTWTVESVDNEFPISNLSLIDADGDSYLDLISGNHILYQELDGTYMHTWYDGLDYITYADLDNDDNNELVGVNGFDNQLFVYSNNDLEKRNYLEVKSKNIFGDGADQIFVTDLNSDSEKDIIVGHSGQRFFTVFIRKETEYLENQMYWMSSGDAIHSLGSIIVQDMNNDGKNDVVMMGQDRFEVLYTK